jgi:hypothetical protein
MQKLSGPCLVTRSLACRALPSARGGCSIDIVVSTPTTSWVTHRLLVATVPYSGTPASVSGFPKNWDTVRVATYYCTSLFGLWLPPICTFTLLGLVELISPLPNASLSEEAVDGC